MHTVIMTAHSNNFLRKSMAALHISAAAASTIVDNPALLGAGGNTTTLGHLGVTRADAALVLAGGYNAGFRYLFVLHACLAGAAALVSFALVQEKSLLRGDEEALKRDARDAGLAVKLAERRRKREGDKAL